MDENCQAFTNKFIEMIKKCVPQKEVTIRLNDKVTNRLLVLIDLRGTFMQTIVASWSLYFLST
jgi:hypothetical protein